MVKTQTEAQRHRTLKKAIGYGAAAPEARRAFDRFLEAAGPGTVEAFRALVIDYAREWETLPVGCGAAHQNLLDALVAAEAEGKTLVSHTFGVLARFSERAGLMRYGAGRGTESLR